MCIDKTNYTCCCGCSMTTAMWIIGGLELLNLVCGGIAHDWTKVVVSFCTTMLFCLAIYDSKSVKLRKVLYYTYTIISIAAFFLFAIIIALLAVTYWIDEPLRDACMSDTDLVPDMFDSVNSCVHTLHRASIVFLCLIFVICVPLRILCCRVLYFGWKEQENSQRQAFQ